MRTVMLCTAILVPLFGVGGMIGGTNIWTSTKPLGAGPETMNIHEMHLKADMKKLPQQEISDLF